MDSTKVHINIQKLIGGRVMLEDETGRVISGNIYKLVNHFELVSEFEGGMPLLEERICAKLRKQLF